MIAPEFLHALRIIWTGLEHTSVEWAVTGSLGMVLQGMDLKVHDIDIQTDRAGVSEIENRFAASVVKSTAFKPGERIRSYLCQLAIAGVQVEIIGDMQKLLPDGRWEDPVRVEQYRRWVDIEAMHVPVLSLEHEYDAYRAMGRIERAQLIRKWLDSSRPR